ncbi:MAG: ferritin [Anaerolineae bacterium]
MISQTMQDAINEQIRAEMYSANLYLSMSAYFEANNLPGLANWMRVQFQEEQSHALKFFDYLFERGGRGVIGALDQPPSDFESPLDIFQKAYAHEQKVTGLINKLYELALKENDYPSQFLLQWYIKEQVEEEKNASTIVEELKQIGPIQGLILHLDHRLGKRGKG